MAAPSKENQYRIPPMPGPGYDVHHDVHHGHHDQGQEGQFYQGYGEKEMIRKVGIDLLFNTSS